MSMDKSMLMAYQERWQAVADVQNAELRHATMTQRWQQLNALVGMAAGLGIVPESDNDYSVIMRWNTLRERYFAQVEER